MEWVSVPWETHRKSENENFRLLTVNLALWLLHILAGNSYDVDWNYPPLREQHLISHTRPATEHTQQPYSVYFKEVERDSGYVSGSRAASFESHSASNHRATTQPSARNQFHNITDLGDMSSVISDPDDIGSLRSEETSYEVKTGEALIGVFLIQDTRFHTFCLESSTKMSKERFIRNLRRLLKSFYKNLREEAETESERAVARLLRSKYGRQRISEKLLAHISDEQNETGDYGRLDSNVPLYAKIRTEKWLERISDKQTEPISEELEKTRLMSSDSDDSHPDIPHGGQEETITPQIFALKEFLMNCRSFQCLIRDFGLMLLPAELKQLLSSIPKRNIWLSKEQDVSLLNWTKGWIEDFSQLTWNWWPLEPRKRLLQENEYRIFWYCVCVMPIKK
jgi:hypothetical protein